MEGVSLRAAFDRQKRFSRSQPIFWEHEGNRAVRIERWKLVSKHPAGWELYEPRGLTAPNSAISRAQHSRSGESDDRTMGRLGQARRRAAMAGESKC